MSGRWVTRYSARGHRFRYWEVESTPRIPDAMQRTVVFVYPGADAAIQGAAVGGTGFLVRWLDPSAQWFHYVVTNSHVVRNGGTTIRINTTAGDIDVIDIPEPEWVHHPDADDVAIASLEPSPEWAVEYLDWTAIVGTRQANAERLTELNVGVGDEAIMLGRFVTPDKHQLNQPLARFGNIAMMPGPKVLDARNLRVEAYLIEMRSLSGYSGSPVFVYIGPGTYRGHDSNTMMPFYTETIGLIGIDTGHKTISSSVVRKGTNEKVNDCWEVRQNAGMAIVAPVTKIIDVLEDDEFVKQRKQQPEPVTHEGAEADYAGDGKEFDRFDALTRKVVRVTKKELDEKRGEKA